VAEKIHHRNHRGHHNHRDYHNHRDRHSQEGVLVRSLVRIAVKEDVELGKDEGEIRIANLVRHVWFLKDEAVLRERVRERMVVERAPERSGIK
jgi:hypothetical protein